MSDRISSSDWTGPLDESRQRGAFTHRVGDHAIATDYQRLLAARLEAERVPPEVRRVRWAAALLFVSPILLWLAWHLVKAATHDSMGWTHTHLLMFWGLGVLALAAWQLQSRSSVLVGLRKAFLFGLLAMTVGLAIAFSYAGIDAYPKAKASEPERTLELYKVRGRGAFRSVTTRHQRADGSTVEEIRVGPPRPYASACALVQRLDGNYGFSWVKVIDRSRPPARGQLLWPIRREECFSNIPLSSLPR